MCVDIYSPGFCIDIELLLEQIWLSLRKKDVTRLDVHEVYDLCLTNRKGNRKLEGIWLLFPHNCTTKENGARKIEVEIWPVTKQISETCSLCEWAFVGPPEDIEGEKDVVKRGYYVDPPTFGGGDTQYLEGKVINATPRFHETFDEKQKEILAAGHICKTVVYLEFDKPLKPGEKGWLRFSVRPQELDVLSLKSRKIGDVPEPFIFEQSASIACPVIVRDKVHKKLMDPRKVSPEKETEGPPVEYLTACRELHNKVFSESILRSGTSTRIKDHRIALIVEDEIEICSSTCTGEVGLMVKIPTLEEIGYTTVLWGCGSNRYMGFDIIWNAISVIEKVVYDKPYEKDDLIHQLSPPGREGPFSLFIDKMKEVKLLKLRPDKKYEAAVIPSPDETRDDFLSNVRFTRLRQKYTPETIDEMLFSALADFCDLHPFQIDFRVKWFGVKAELAQWLHPLIDWLNEKSKGPGKEQE